MELELELGLVELLLGLLSLLHLPNPLHQLMTSTKIGLNYRLYPLKKSNVFKLKSFPRLLLFFSKFTGITNPLFSNKN